MRCPPKENEEEILISNDIVLNNSEHRWDLNYNVMGQRHISNPFKPLILIPDKHVQFNESFGFIPDVGKDFKNIMTLSPLENEFHSPSCIFKTSNVDKFLSFPAQKSCLTSVSKRKNRRTSVLPFLVEDDSCEVSNSSVDLKSDSCSTLSDSDDILYVSFPAIDDCLDEATPETPTNKEVTRNEDCTLCSDAHFFTDSQAKLHFNVPIENNIYESIHNTALSLSDPKDTDVDSGVNEDKYHSDLVNFSSMQTKCKDSTTISSISNDFEMIRSKDNRVRIRNCAARLCCSSLISKTRNVGNKSKLRNIMTFSRNEAAEPFRKNPYSLNDVNNYPLFLSFLGNNYINTDSHLDHSYFPISQMEHSSMHIVPCNETRTLPRFVSFIVEKNTNKSRNLELKYLKQKNETSMFLFQERGRNAQSPIWDHTNKSVSRIYKKNVVVESNDSVGCKSFTGEPRDSSLNVTDENQIFSENSSMVDIARKTKLEKDEYSYKTDKSVCQSSSSYTRNSAANKSTIKMCKVESDFDDVCDLRDDCDAECILIVSSDNSLNDISTDSRTFEGKSWKRTRHGTKKTDHSLRNRFQSPHFDKDPILLEYFNFETEDKEVLVVYPIDYMKRMKSRRKKSMSKKELAEELIKSSKTCSGSPIGILFGIKEELLLLKRKVHKKRHSTPLYKHSEEGHNSRRKIDKKCTLSAKSPQEKSLSSTFIKKSCRTKTTSTDVLLKSSAENDTIKRKLSCSKECNLTLRTPNVGKTGQNKSSEHSLLKAGLKKGILTFPISKSVESTPATPSFLARKRMSADRVISSDFKALFRSYAKLGNRLKSGSVMSKTNSNFWLKKGGVIYDDKSASVADQCFNEVAGKKLVLNIHDYAQYLTVICKRRKAILVDVVDQLKKAVLTDLQQTKKVHQASDLILIPTVTSDDHNSSAVEEQSLKRVSSTPSKIPVPSQSLSRQQ